MKDMMKMNGNTFTEYNVLSVNLREMVMKHSDNYMQKRIYDLFTYLVNKGYKMEAADIWDKMINHNFFATT